MLSQTFSVSLVPTEPRADSLDWHQGLVGHGLHGLALVTLVAKYGQGPFVFLLLSLVGHCPAGY